MQQRGRSVLLALVAIACAAAAVISPLVANVVVAVTVLVLGACVARARREERLLRRTRSWLLAAVAAGFVSSVLSVLQELVGATIGYPAPSDLVGLLYIPCTVVALSCVPLDGRRKGFRARALADGGIAASSLWFLLAPPLTGLAERHHAALATATALAFPMGDVFIVAAALTTLARCAPAARHVALWLAVGLTAIAAADLGYALAPADGGGWRRLVFQAGLTALLGAAVGRSPLHRAQHDVHRESTWALGVLPFLPFFACLAYSSGLVRRGLGLPPEQMAPAVAVAVALMLRQFVGGRDKERLVVELAAREAHLTQELRRDPLTGVGNRRDLHEALERALDDQRGPFVLAVVDLDDFKLINDNHGHETGDHVLRHVANRLLATVRAGDVVARLGGDEFAVLLHGSATTDGVAERFLRALEEPVVLERRQFRLSASIGVIVSQEGDSIERLLADADGAMYEAKEDRARSTVVSLDAGGRLGVARRSQVREDIAAPVLEQFEVHYQPVVELATGRVRGVEALLRWNHPDLGRVPPDVFVPLAEQCGSIDQLGDFVLTTAVHDLASLVTLAPLTRFAMGVNVSPRQLASPEFAERASWLLAQAGLDPDQLVVEITEQAFEADLDPMRGTVSRLMAAGVSVAVDDFGTGYSSLRYLQRLDIDVLKIDRSFVAEAGEAARPQRLIQGIMALAQRLDLQVIAEGIETPAQLAYLAAAGCQLGQGYLFSPPVAVPELVRLMQGGPLLPPAPRELPAPRAAEDVTALAGG